MPPEQGEHDPSEQSSPQGLHLPPLHFDFAASLAATFAFAFAFAAVTFAYFANRSYVFRSRNKHILSEAAAFFAARIGTLLMDMGIMFVFVTLLGFSDKIMKLVVQVVVTVANYVFSKLMVFRKKGEKPEDSGQDPKSPEEGAAV